MFHQVFISGTPQDDMYTGQLSKEVMETDQQCIGNNIGCSLNDSSRKVNHQLKSKQFDLDLKDDVVLNQFKEECHELKISPLVPEQNSDDEDVKDIDIKTENSLLQPIKPEDYLDVIPKPVKEDNLEQITPHVHNLGDSKIKDGDLNIDNSLLGTINPEELKQDVISQLIKEETLERNIPHEQVVETEYVLNDNAQGKAVVNDRNLTQSTKTNVIMETENLNNRVHVTFQPQTIIAVENGMTVTNMGQILNVLGALGSVQCQNTNESNKHSYVIYKENNNKNPIFILSNSVGEYVTPNEKEFNVQESKNTSSYSKKKSTYKNDISLPSARSKNVYKCDICSKPFTYKSNLMKHIDSHTNPKASKLPKLPKVESSVICKNCNGCFVTQSKYTQHMKYSLCGGYKRSSSHQCDICGKLYSKKSNLQAHINSHTNTMPYKCSDCDKYFGSKETRQMHHKSMHLNKKNRFLCCYCGIITLDLSHLNAHEEIHRLPEGADIPKPFRCLICGKGFISNFKLARHKREHRPRKCSKCNDSFTNESQLEKHVKDVHGDGSYYTCKTCSKSFEYRSALRTHIKIHTRALSFFCDICEKGFKMKHQIEQHMITHSDERPIACSLCKDRFKRKTHLKQHMASAHSKESQGIKSRKKKK